MSPDSSPMMLLMSLTPAVVAFRRYSFLWLFSAAMFATVVFPVPLGP